MSVFSVSFMLRSHPRSEDTNLFIIVDLLKVGVERIRESSSDELSLREVGKTLHVELTLKILERQSIVEDSNVASRRSIVVDNDGSIALGGWSSNSEASGQCREE